MSREFRIALSSVAVSLALSGLGHSATLTTTGSSGIAAYTAWNNLLTGTPTDISVPSEPGSYNTSSGFSLSSGNVVFHVVGIDPQQSGGYYLTLAGNALTDGSGTGSYMSITFSQSINAVLFAVKSSPDPTQTLGLTLSNGANITIPGSVTYFGVVSSTPLSWATIISYSNEVTLSDISFGTANPADFPQTAADGKTVGLVATGLAMIVRGVKNRLARLQKDFS